MGGVSSSELCFPFIFLGGGCLSVVEWWSSSGPARRLLCTGNKVVHLAGAACAIRQR